MTTLWPLLATALVLGAQHSFGPDHVAAVGLFVSRRPSWRRALGLGVRWGVGHSAAILLLGGALAVSGLHLPERFAPFMERGVGAMLVVLGLMAFWRSRRLHGHWHEHDGGPHWHLHGHARTAEHDHDHRALLGIGMMHGLAGTGALAVLVSATVPSAPHAIAFLAAFALGTIVAMGLFSAAAGWALSAASHRSAVIARGAALIAAAASVAVGSWWLAAGGA